MRPAMLGPVTAAPAPALAVPAASVPVLPVPAPAAPIRTETTPADVAVPFAPAGESRRASAPLAAAWVSPQGPQVVAGRPVEFASLQAISAWGGEELPVVPPVAPRLVPAETPWGKENFAPVAATPATGANLAFPEAAPLPARASVPGAPAEISFMEQTVPHAGTPAAKGGEVMPAPALFAAPETLQTEALAVAPSVPTPMEKPRPSAAPTSGAERSFAFPEPVLANAPGIALPAATVVSTAPAVAAKTKGLEPERVQPGTTPRPAESTAAASPVAAPMAAAPTVAGMPPVKAEPGVAPQREARRPQPARGPLARESFSPVEAAPTGQGRTVQPAAAEAGPAIREIAAARGAMERTPDSDPTAAASLQATKLPAERPTTESGTTPATRTEVVQIVERTVDAALRLRATGPERLELAVQLESGERLTIELRLAGGEVTSVFRTSSEGLRAALEQQWTQFSERAGDRGVRLTPPVFDGSQSGSDMTDLSQQRHGRDPGYTDPQAELFPNLPRRRPAPRVLPTDSLPSASALAESVRLYA